MRRVINGTRHAFMKRQLAVILRFIARLMLGRFAPGIVAVTGSVGKTSTKTAIATVLRSERRIRAAAGSHNNEFGVPLTIIGDWNPRELALVSKEASPRGRLFQKILFWSKVFLLGVARFLFLSRARYPEMLVLEYGADRPGDLKRLIEIARPQISVVTAVGDVPVHVEFYDNPAAVAREKRRLVEILPMNGFAILNADDEAVLRMRETTRAHVLTFGFSEEAEVRVTNFENRAERGTPAGVSFKLEYGGSFVPIRIDGCFGKGVAYASAAAAAVAIVFGIHLVRIAEALSFYEAPPHRQRLVPGIKGSFLIDDSYNASPLSMEAAIETMRALPGNRKVGILGDMLEIGKYTIEAHENIGKLAAKTFDVIVAIGPRAKFIADSAIARGMARKNVMTFETVDDARLKVADLIRKGDLVLIKASRAIQLDKIVEELRQI